MDLRYEWENFMKGKDKIMDWEDGYEKEFADIVYYNKLFDENSIMYTIYQGEEKCKEKYGSEERELVNIFKILVKLFIEDNSPYGPYIIFDPEKYTGSRDMKNWWQRSDKEGIDVHRLNITDIKILASCLWLNNNTMHVVEKLFNEIKPDYIIDAFTREEDEGQLFNTADLHLYYIKNNGGEDEIGLHPTLEHKVITLIDGFDLESFIYSFNPESSTFLLSRYYTSDLSYAFNDIARDIVGYPISLEYKELRDFVCSRRSSTLYEDEAKKNNIDINNVTDFICKYIKYILECKPEEISGIGELWDRIDSMYKYYSTHAISTFVDKVDINEIRRES